jgi:spermidine/putrescine transport system ATP-binding protein
VNHPKVLLLDEPLGALDLKLRKAMQLELKALQGMVGITFIYVTHDQEEALTMSDRIGVMRAGSLLQVGTPQEVYEMPSSRFVAEFIGDTNSMKGELSALRDGLAEVALAPGIRVLAIPAQGLPAGGAVSVGFRPEKVRPAEETIPSDHNALECTVADVVYTGSNVTLILQADWGASLMSRRQNEAGDIPQATAPGQRITVCWPISATKAFAEEAA